MKRHNVEVGDLHFAFSVKVLTKLHDKQARYPYLPVPSQIMLDFQELSRRRGVPIAIKPQNGKNMLLLYTSSYYVTAFPSEQKNDGYSVYYVDALNLHEHERLAQQGVIWLRAVNWHWYTSLKEIEEGNSNYWEDIENVWQMFESQQQHDTTEIKQEDIPLRHENYLNAVDSLIEIEHRFEQDKYSIPSLIPYRLVESSDEKRYAPRDSYVFHLSGDYPVSEKMLVRLKETPDLQGQIVAIKGNIITVKFHGMVDRLRIRRQGSFEPIMNSAIFRAQQEAINILRKHQSRNVHLLNILIDHQYQPFKRSEDSPSQPLDTEQLEAFQRALTVPDVLLVLGPPGTGKTRTITEIAQACSTRRQRVLITSGTHKAVDNVLERLPSTELLIVRIGHEDHVSERIRPKLLEEQAAEMQQNILQRTANDYRRLAIFIEYRSTLDQWLIQLSSCIDDFIRAHWYLQQAFDRESTTLQQLKAPYASRLNELESSLDKLERKYQRREEEVGRWMNKHAWLETKKLVPIIGIFFQRLSNYYTKRISRSQQRISAIHMTYEDIHSEYTAIQDQLQLIFQENPEYRSSVENRKTIEEYIARSQKSALTLARQLSETLIHLMKMPPELETLPIERLLDFLNWYRSIRPLLENRATLLHNWRKKLETRNEQQLNPELFRYADIVGATCIGIATAKGLEDIEFDIGIVDEAGQISLPDLLVPLVRTKRAVLVGDHHQLPPFVDRAVQTWLDGLSPQALQSLGITETDEEGTGHLTELLTKSAFEHLFTAQMSYSHNVRFTQQRRMPRVIADFCARHFYEGRLSTCRTETPTYSTQFATLFTKPLIFVDTSDVPFVSRKEAKTGVSHYWEEVGIYNELEAELISKIAAFYQHVGSEWVVIVPYRAQAQRIVQQLQKKWQFDEDETKLEERVSTVDSFQGRESNIVIYGFTRSNDHRSIGFLAEERRLNVAITRTRERLILIGDLSTLTRSTDKEFSQLIRSLKEHVQQYGELLSYAQCQNHLRSQN